MKLSDEELSRWIAEKLEPEPTLKSVCWKYVPDERHVYNRKLGGYERIVLVRDSGNYKPRDMVNDPAMTVMLLGQLVQFAPQFYPMDRGVMLAVRGINRCVADSIGRAVAEAWALATGYKEP